MTRWLGPARLRALAVGLGLMVVAPAARAADEDDASPSQAEVEAWLDARAVSGTRDVGTVEEQPEAPPPPPHHRGLVVETSVGAHGHLGAMKNVSPTAPWFHVHLGYEIFDWVMVFGESDVSFSDTQFANPPPDPRTYALYGFGGGVRFTVRPIDRFGIFVQGSIGAARVTEDVLQIYGFRDADELNPYFGALGGLEWYQVSPHYALALQGGVRNYGATFERVNSTESSLAWIGAIALRYTF